VGKTTSTHFAKPKLKHKHNSLYAKNSKMQKYIPIKSKAKIRKRPLKLPQDETSSLLENGMDPKKFENP
jgi:hypothetical protein